MDNNPRVQGTGDGAMNADGDDAAMAAPATATPTFTTGRVLLRTWRVMMSNPLLYLCLAFVPLIPTIISDSVNRTMTRAVELSVGSCLSLLLQAAIAYAVYRSLCGERATIWEALAKGLKRFFPLLGTLLVVEGLTIVGLILLVIPGIVFVCISIVTIPACVVEHRGPLDSLQRSSVLTRHHRWTIFILLAVVFAVSFAINYAMIPLRRFPSLAVVYMPFLLRLPLIIPAAFNSVMVAVIYYTLREVKEGVAAENLADVFD